MNEAEFLGDIVVILLVAVVVVAALRRIGVPTIAGLVLTGVLIGPRAIGLVDDLEEVRVLTEIGVALLLFGIGVEISPSRLQRLWRPIVLGGALQVGITVLCTAAVAYQLGFGIFAAVFLGFLVSLSSTAIVLRGLETSGQVDAPQGRLTVGILLFQDLCVIPMILLVPVLAGVAATEVGLGLAFGKTFLILASVLIGAWFLVPRVLHYVAATRQRDLFVLTVVLVCIGTAWAVSLSGISIALGAFLAGLIVAESEYRHQAISELIPFREVLTSLFFISIGMLLDPSVLWKQPLSVFGLLLAILVGKSLIVFLVAMVIRLPFRVSVLSAVALSQVGEFSFVLMKAAEDTSLFSGTLTEVVLSAAVLSMILTPLTILIGPQLVAGAGKVRSLTRWMGVTVAADADAGPKHRKDHIIIAGYGVAGKRLASALRTAKIPYLVVDLNPSNVHQATADGELAFYGDITSVEILRHLDILDARAFVIVLNDPGAVERAIQTVRETAPKLHIVARATYLDDYQLLKKVGANHVLISELESAISITQHVLTSCGVGDDVVDSLTNDIRSRELEIVE